MTFAVMTVFASGISLNLLAQLLHSLLGWNYDISLVICSAIVLVYVLKGGLTSAMYTEVLQFFMNRARLRAGRLARPQGRRRLVDVEGHAPGRLAGPGQARPQHPHLCPRCLDQRVDAGHRRSLREPDGRRSFRHDLRPRLRAVVRILVHELPRHSARDGGQGYERRAPHPAHRRGAEDALPRAGHFAGDDRGGLGREGDGWLSPAAGDDFGWRFSRGNPIRERRAI